MSLSRRSRRRMVAALVCGVALALLGIGTGALLIRGAWLAFVDAEAKKEHARCLMSGRRSLSEVRDFVALFPVFTHAFFSGEPETQGDFRWQFVARVDDRHVLRMSLDVSEDVYGNLRLHGEPSFRVSQIISTSTFAQAGSDSPTGRLVKEFGPEEWSALVEADGDLGAIGVGVECQDGPGGGG